MIDIPFFAFQTFLIEFNTLIHNIIYNFPYGIEYMYLDSVIILERD